MAARTKPHKSASLQESRRASIKSPVKPQPPPAGETGTLEEALALAEQAMADSHSALKLADDNLVQMELLENRLKELSTLFTRQMEEMKKAEGPSEIEKKLSEDLKATLKELEKKMLAAQKEMDSATNEMGRKFEKALGALKTDSESSKHFSQRLSALEEDIEKRFRRYDA